MSVDLSIAIKNDKGEKLKVETDTRSSQTCVYYNDNLVLVVATGDFGLLCGGFLGWLEQDE